MQRTELDASIAKQAFVTSGIPKLHFVKLTKKDLGGWKSKDKYEMRNGVVFYSFICSLAYPGKCPA